MRPDREILRDETRLDEALAETFPASDPPSYMAGISILGAPAGRGSGAEAAKGPARGREVPVPSS